MPWGDPLQMDCASLSVIPTGWMIKLCADAGMRFGRTDYGLSRAVSFGDRPTVVLDMRRPNHAVQAILAIALATAFVSCTSGGINATRDDALAGTVTEAVNGLSPGETLDFSSLVAGDWSRITVFPAYQTNKIARATLGFDFDIESTPSQSDDRTNVIVFSGDRGILRWFVVDRSRVNFGVESSPIVIPRTEAALQLSTDPYGDPILARPSP